MLHYHGESWREASQGLEESGWQAFLATAAKSPQHLSAARDTEAHAMAVARLQAYESHLLQTPRGRDTADNPQDEAGSAAETEGSWRDLSVEALQAIYTKSFDPLKESIRNFEKKKNISCGWCIECS